MNFDFLFWVCREFEEHPAMRKAESYDFIISDMHVNDFGFYSVHRLYATEKMISKHDSLFRNTPIGSFAIMDINNPGKAYALYNRVASTGSFCIKELPDGFISMPLSLDSAEILASLMDKGVCDKFASAIHMMFGDDCYETTIMNSTLTREVFFRSFLRGMDWVEHKKMLSEYLRVIGH